MHPARRAELQLGQVHDAHTRVEGPAQDVEDALGVAEVDLTAQVQRAGADPGAPDLVVDVVEVPGHHLVGELGLPVRPVAAQRRHPGVHGHPAHPVLVQHRGVRAVGHRGQHRRPGDHRQAGPPLVVRLVDARAVHPREALGRARRLRLDGGRLEHLHLLVRCPADERGQHLVAALRGLELVDDLLPAPHRVADPRRDRVTLPSGRVVALVHQQGVRDAFDHL
ncbi:hypothetical protein KDL28_06010 [Pseudonocardia sp. S2-4]|uniref:Uncharacterized protein n=1 Tax=Pseudonocardia humida TaxID=2800819 RepID=A0ABT0ZV40_9PSEU|nr:hypothetical protein [Pseudonocardia humida]MCO1654607.1 hypothetical protein [Pseudonocardia humida]